jgi:hypothetical protein
MTRQFYPLAGMHEPPETRIIAAFSYRYRESANAA